MSSPTPSSDDRAASLLARFQAEHASFLRPELDAWIDAHAELRDSPELRMQVLSLHALAERDRLSPDAARIGRSGSDTARPRGAFGPRSADRDAPSNAPLAGVTFVPGQRIGRFELRRFLAQGGMGLVWEAWDQDLRRRVALKLMLPEVVHTRGLELFAREARAGARLEHPNIVRTHAFGTDEGFTWIAQELIEGSWTLKDALDELRSSGALPEGYYRHVAQFAAQLADALAAAHEAGVIHRDIKPQNVLIAPDESPKLADFGLARVLDDSVLSRTGDFAGTYAYMSPEQVTAKRMGLDHRTDIFSLGVVLYELLTLHRPFDGDTAHQIAERIVAWDPPEAWRVRSQCPRELAIVCGKALEKLPGARYQTMTEFAADLRRHLADEPILARPPSALMRVVKWSRRHPVISASAAVAGAAFAVVAWLYVENVRANKSLRESNNTIEAKNTELAEATKAARENEQLAKKNATAAEERTREARRSLYMAAITGAQSALRTNEIGTAHRLLNTAPEELRNWEWGYLNAASDTSVLKLRGRSAVFSPDGTRIATILPDHTVGIWSSTAGSLLAQLVGHTEGLCSVTFSPDGDRIVTASRDDTARIWDTNTGCELALLDGHPGDVLSAVFSLDGGRVLTTCTDHSMCIWDARRGLALARMLGHTSDIGNAAFSSDGLHVLSISGDNTARVWDAMRGTELSRVESDPDLAFSAAFSPDGSSVAVSTGRDGDTAFVQDLLTGRLTTLLNSAWVDHLQYSADASRIVGLVSGNATVVVWNAHTGAVVTRLEGHVDPIQSIAFNADRSAIVTASWDRTARVWSATTGQQLALLCGHESWLRNASFSPDGAYVVTSPEWDAEEEFVRVWDVMPNEVLAHFDRDGLGCLPNDVAWSPDSLRVAVAVWDQANAVHVFDATTKEELAQLRGHTNAVTTVEFSPDGSSILTASHDKTARVWSAVTGEEEFVLSGHTDRVSSASYSRDGRFIVTASEDGTTRIWNSTSRTEITRLGANRIAVQYAAFDVTGRFVATSSGDDAVQLWDARTGTEVRQITSHEGGGPCTFSLDGKRLAVAGIGAASLWNIPQYDEPLLFTGHTSFLRTVGFSCDCTRLVTSSGDRTARVWDITSGQQVILLAGHSSELESAEFSADGTRIVTASADSTVRTWDSVSNRRRYAARQELTAARAEAKRALASALAGNADWSAASSKLRANPKLPEPVRHVALNLLTQQANAAILQAMRDQKPIEAKGGH